MGLPQGSALSHVLYNVCTKGPADLTDNGLSRVLTLVDVGLIYKIANDTYTAITAVQEQSGKVLQWCQETRTEINSSKAQALWCTLRNKVVGQAMPAISFNREVIKRKNSLRYLGFVCLLVGCLTSQQHASVSQRRICSDNCTCCHTEIEVADQTFYLTQSQYTDTGPTSPSADPITPGAWQGSHWSAKFWVTGMTRPRKNPVASGIRTRDLPLPRRTPYH